MKRSMSRLVALALAGGMAVMAADGFAQAGAAAGAAVTDSAAANRDSMAAAAPRVTIPRTRAAWTGDRVALRVGDLLTVVVDEQIAASERVTRTSSDSRATSARLRAELGSDPMNYNLQSGLDQGSRDFGEANREGDLTAVLTVRVTAIEPGGIARIEGARKVTVDGRVQDLSITGFIRPEDVMPSHYVLSSRIGEAVINYKGKKIGPRTGIIGKFLGMLWP